ncbi:hypothetical protein [Mycolicibacterium aichiense]|uniref:Transmembrane protein n=1 Tax=Mycolicibacterium aichiense TaxID=1799 RepID=A0AAD1HQW7_9MYCO|nr:hypothetical protein [Mycolicibacterium aichiense]MCV7016159.1 hypothetical protein [Mycolicibacterium aichiense]BBX10077.1 hypothetical protein MAIC_48800 [Mycolicibacterium aichiense]STZ26257.1 conserved transmembrane protein [Mycolicibacterium aichiense]
MTAPEDSENSRPISVAELLAKNGTIGSPPVGGRRRRRRGNSDAVTVAELTGEIPIIRTGEMPVVREDPVLHEDEVAEEPVEQELAVQPPAATNGAAAATEVVEDDQAAELHEEHQDEAKERPFDGPPPRSDSPLPRREQRPERSYDPRPLRRPEPTPADESDSDAEQMAFDPVDEAAPVLDLTADEHVDEAVELQSYLRSSAGALFSGQTVADDLARRGVAEDEHDGDAASADRDVQADHAEDRPREGKLTALWRGLLVAGQSILAVAFGAGLFIAFDQLWRWNNIVALVLSVLVILGLVVAVRIVRKTEDIASTLIAVAVGALVTLGPLALLQST